MAKVTSCPSCTLRTGCGRCSFQRLVSFAVRSGRVLDYYESPKVISLQLERHTALGNPEEARLYLCRLLASSSS